MIQLEHFNYTDLYVWGFFPRNHSQYLSVWKEPKSIQNSFTLLIYFSDLNWNIFTNQNTLNFVALF